MSSQEMDPANTRDRSRSPLRSQSPIHTQRQSPRRSLSQSPRRSLCQSPRRSLSQSPRHSPNQSLSPLPNQSLNPLPNHSPSPLPNQSPRPLRSQSPLSTKTITQKNKNFNLLHFKNIPKNWTIVNIKNFIKANTAHEVNIVSKQTFIQILKDNQNNSKGECVIKFRTPNFCRHVYKLLSGCCYKGKRIIIQVKCESSFPHIKFPDLTTVEENIKNIKKGINNKLTRFIKSEQRPPRQGSAHMNPRPRLEKAGNSDKYERYGLSLSFLESIGVTLPLSNKIFVGNLDPGIEETKLWSVFGLAGVVLSVVLIHNESKPFAFARIEYDHPVEAVQALSMFNNQMFYNNKMVVQMDKFQKKIMPAGLENIGPGLGPNGQPLRGIRNAIELLPFKESIMKELEKLNNDNNKVSENQQSQLSSVYSNPNLSSVPNSSFTSNQLLGGLNMNITDNNLISSLSNILNPQSLNPLLNLQGIQNYLNTLSAVQSQSTSQNSGNSQNLIDTVQNIMGTGQNMMGTSQNMMSTNQKIVDPAQNMMGINQNAIINNQNLIGNSQNMVSTIQKVMTTNQNLMSTSQHMGTSQNMTSIGHNFGYNQEGSVYSNNEMPNEFVRYNDSLKSENTFRETRDDYKRDHRSSIKKSPNKELEDRKSMNSTDMLMFMYLPPHVTAEALSRKMREVGDLKFVEITGNGRALVRFKKSEDASRCKYLFDHTKVDGQTIRVKYF